MRSILLCALAACSFRHGGALAVGGDGPSPVDTRGSDAIDARPIDAPPDACTMHVLPPAANVDPATWKAKFLTAPVWNCNASGTTTITANAGSLQISSTSCAFGTIDGTTDVAQTTGGSNVTVVRLRGLTISNGHTLLLRGSQPIVFLVAGDVSVDSGGLIDAGAVGATAGPGAATCANQLAGLGVAGSGGWGGGGGGFGTAGGQGGYDTTNGGFAAPTLLAPLRGGCTGGPTGGGTGFGGGGGAFEISASGTIAIGATAAANLSAGGGGGPITNGGGNGGGAGGGILLVSPALATLGTNGAIRANGGAGSSGNNASSSGGTNIAGQDGHATDANQATDTSTSTGNDHGRVGGVVDLTMSGLAALAGSSTGTTTNGRGGGGGGGGVIVVTTGSTSMSCD